MSFDSKDLDKIPRNLSLAAIQVLAEEFQGTNPLLGLTIAEPLATNIDKSIIYAKGIPGLAQIYVSNYGKDVDGTKEEISKSGVDKLLTLVCESPLMLMLQHRKHSQRFNIVDLDPCEDCISTLLDSAVQCVSDGGLLMITILNSTIGLPDSDPDLIYRQYGVIMPRSSKHHEISLRVLLKCIESHANRNGRYIEPLLSVKVNENCMRLFVKVFTSPVICKQTLSKLSMVHECKCRFALQPLGIAQPVENKPNRYHFSLPRGPPVKRLCENCNEISTISGPIWSGPLHNKEFVSKLAELIKKQGFDANERLQKMLATVQDELSDCLYYKLDELNRVFPDKPSIHLDSFRNELQKAGFQVSTFHMDDSAIKTNAVWSDICQILKSWT